MTCHSSVTDGVHTVDIVMKIYDAVLTTSSPDLFIVSVIMCTVQMNGRNLGSRDSIHPHYNGVRTSNPIHCELYFT